MKRARLVALPVGQCWIWGFQKADTRTHQGHTQYVYMARKKPDCFLNPDYNWKPIAHANVLLCVANTARKHNHLRKPVAEEEEEEGTGECFLSAQ